jgi:hypothetical protein
MKRHFVLAVIITISLSLLVGSSCSSKPRSKSIKADTAEPGTVKAGEKNPTSQANADPGIDLNCVYDRLQNPTESFSYSFAKDTSDDQHLSQAADITPQSIDGRSRSIGNENTVPFQATRVKPEDWQAAIIHLTAIGGMSSTIAIVNHNSAMRLESDGRNTNGYDTIHYSIDTARFDATESRMLLSPGDSEKGDAWVTREGCPVKLVLDSELHRRDGSLIDKIHYEESMVKK